ncbi:hypothetical protein [Fusobacterium sp. PH5-44]|uniref:hypothetical protein n=1 Tax=unclassified Fusobacterium TaxID=2648384 RepID=UPI003D1DB1B1
MKSKDQIVLIDLFIHNNLSVIKQWFEKMKLFEPKQMCATTFTKGNYKKYNEKQFFGELEREISKEKYTVSYNDQVNTISYIRNRNSKDVLIASANLSMDIYKKNQEEITFLINEIMEKCGVVARIVHLDDYFWQNNIDKNYYSLHNKSLDGIPLRKAPKHQNKMIVDVYKMPGYEEIINNIWFGAAWKMWFCSPYYEYIPEEILLEYKDAYKMEKLSFDCVYINLYEDISDYDEPVNRALQTKFKEIVNFDEVVEMARKDKRYRAAGPETEIKEGNFSHGGIKLFRVYLDNSNKNVPKSKATKVRVIEYDKSGKVVWSEVREIEFNSMWSK